MDPLVEDLQQLANVVHTVTCSKTLLCDDRYCEVQELLHLVRSDANKTQFLSTQHTSKLQENIRLNMQVIMWLAD